MQCCKAYSRNGSVLGNDGRHSRDGQRGPKSLVGQESLIQTTSGQPLCAGPLLRSYPLQIVLRGRRRQRRPLLWPQSPLRWPSLPPAGPLALSAARWPAGPLCHPLTMVPCCCGGPPATAAKPGQQRAAGQQRRLPPGSGLQVGVRRGGPAGPAQRGGRGAGL